MVACLLHRNRIRNFLISAIMLMASANVFAEENIDQFRFLSMIIRDQLPSVQEAKDFYNKQKNLDEFVNSWIASSEHKQRVRRYFDDMFGTEQGFFVSSEHHDLTKSNHYIEVRSNNRYIDFQDGSDNDANLHSIEVADSSEISVTGSVQFQDPDAFATLIQSKMNAVASSGVTISVTYSSGTDKLTFAASGTATFELLWSTGPNAGESLGTSIGFAAADDTGAITYIADNTYDEAWSDNIPSDLLATRQLDVYYLPSFAKSTCFGGGSTTPVLADVWWSDIQQNVCPTAISTSGFNTVFYGVEAADAQIHFTDDDGTFDASLSVQGYETGVEVAAAIELAMEATPSNRDYTVTFDAAQKKIYNRR